MQYFLVILHFLCLIMYFLPYCTLCLLRRGNLSLNWFSWGFIHFSSLIQYGVFLSFFVSARACKAFWDLVCVPGLTLRSFTAVSIKNITSHRPPSCDTQRLPSHAEICKPGFKDGCVKLSAESRVKAEAINYTYTVWGSVCTMYSSQGSYPSRRWNTFIMTWHAAHSPD